MLELGPLATRREAGACTPGPKSGTLPRNYANNQTEQRKTWEADAPRKTISRTYVKQDGAEIAGPRCNALSRAPRLLDVLNMGGRD